MTSGLNASRSEDQNPERRGRQPRWSESGRNRCGDHARRRRRLRRRAFTVYFILIFIRVLLSWIPRMPYYRGCAQRDFIHQVVDPF